MNGFTIYDDNYSTLMGLNGAVQLNPETAFGNLETSRPAFAFAPEPVDVSLDKESLKLDDKLLTKIWGSDTDSKKRDPLADPVGALGEQIKTAALMDATGKAFLGAGLNTAASAVKVFDNLINWNVNRHNIDLTRKNTKLAADNQMAALDHQVLYVKNQLMDKFNTVVANNAVNIAARNLRATTANILEASKDTAHDINMDFRTAESNAELQKINLRNQKRQASIASQYAKRAQATEFINAAGMLGLNIATGGMTGKSWGQLYSGFMASIK